MTEFELSYLLIETVSYTGDLFLGAVSIMTGFVVIGLFFGQMLNRLMTLMLVGGYTLVMFGTTAQLNRIWINFLGIAIEIRARHAETGAFDWHGITRTPEVLLNIAPYFTTVVILGAYTGTLIFFFQTRKLDPKEFR